MQKDVDEASAVCIANIGPGGRRRRLKLGALALGVGVAIGVALFAAGVPRVWRLFLLLPLWLGALGFFQARDKI